jgi:hypothetical protein
VRTGINRSERNRPAVGDGSVDAGDDTGVRSRIDEVIANGLEPDDVAALVLDAVLSGRFSVLTHADWASGVVRRAERLVAGDQPEFVLPTKD